MAKAKPKSSLDGLIVRKGAASPVSMPISPLTPQADERDDGQWANSSIDPSLMLTPDAGSHRKKVQPGQVILTEEEVDSGESGLRAGEDDAWMEQGEASYQDVVVEVLTRVERVADVFAPRHHAQVMPIPAAANRFGSKAISAIVYLRADQLLRLSDASKLQDKNVSDLVESAVDCFLDKFLSHR